MQARITTKADIVTMCWNNDVFIVKTIVTINNTDNIAINNSIFFILFYT